MGTFKAATFFVEPLSFVFEVFEDAIDRVSVLTAKMSLIGQVHQFLRYEALVVEHHVQHVSHVLSGGDAENRLAGDELLIACLRSRPGSVCR